jgi:hypothetical protein
MCTTIAMCAARRAPVRIGDRQQHRALDPGGVEQRHQVGRRDDLRRGVVGSQQRGGGGAEQVLVMVGRRRRLGRGQPCREQRGGEHQFRKRSEHSGPHLIMVAEVIGLLDRHGGFLFRRMHKDRRSAPYFIWLKAFIRR